MSVEPESHPSPSELARRKHRLIGVITSLALIALALAIFAIRARQHAEADSDYRFARDVIASMISGDRAACGPDLEKALSAMRKQLGRAKAKTGLINHKAMIYHQVLEGVHDLCGAGSHEPSFKVDAAEPCSDANDCFNQAFQFLLSGNLDQAQNRCRRGIALDDSAPLRELLKLIRQMNADKK